MIKAHAAGDIYAPLQPYEPDTWYKIHVVLDTIRDTFSVWIDGELRGKNFKTRFSSTGITSFIIVSGYGNTKAFFDDTTICQNH